MKCYEDYLNEQHYYSLYQKHFNKLAQTAFQNTNFYLIKQIWCNFY
jgi:hypothetical protein